MFSKINSLQTVKVEVLSCIIDFGAIIYVRYLYVCIKVRATSEKDANSASGLNFETPLKFYVKYGTAGALAQRSGTNESPGR